MIAGEHAQAAGVDAERLVEAELGAEVGDRAAELARRAAARTSARSRSPCRRRSRPGRVRYSAMKFGSSRSADQSRAPWSTGTGLRWRAQPRGRCGEEDAHLRVPRPVEVEGETREALERGGAGAAARGPRRGSRWAACGRGCYTFLGARAASIPPCASSWSPPSASPSPRPAAWPTSSTRWRGRWGAGATRSTSCCLSTAGCDRPTDRSAAARSRCPWGFRRGPVPTRVTWPRSTSWTPGRRLPAAPRGPSLSFDRARLLRRQRRRLPGQRRPVHAPGPRGAGGDARRGAPVDVLHGHDWQAAPALLALRAAVAAADPVLAGVATVLTCHNLAYHGWVPRDRAWQLATCRRAIGEPHGVDLLREGDPRRGHGEHGQPDLRPRVAGARVRRRPGRRAARRGDRYIGILNGIDTGLWDPATDAALPARYSADGHGRQGRLPGGPGRAPRPRPRRRRSSAGRPARPAEGLRPR